MLENLKFVAGSVNKKEIILALAHFKIQNKTIRGYNGTMGLCGPIDLDLDITPKAEQLIKAIQTCDDTIALHITPKGKLSIKSGSFKALIDCIANEEFPEINPEGELIELKGPFLESIKKLYPFISDDASRQWSRGVLFKGQSAFATNNVILVEAWLGFDFPVTVNVPKTAINELIRIDEEPISLQVSPTRITFHFSGDRWLCCQTYSTEWPDLSKVLNRENTPKEPPAGLKGYLENLIPFLGENDKVIFNDFKVSTAIGTDVSGASYDLPDLDFEAAFNCKMLLKVLDIAELIDFSAYPQPCLFQSGNIRGAIIGLLL